MNKGDDGKDADCIRLSSIICCLQAEEPGKASDIHCESKDLTTRGADGVSLRVLRPKNYNLAITLAHLKRNWEFALPSPFYFLFLGPQWVGWCPPTLVTDELPYSVYLIKCQSLPETSSQTPQHNVMPAFCVFLHPVQSTYKINHYLSETKLLAYKSNCDIVPQCQLMWKISNLAYKGQFNLYQYVRLKYKFHKYTIRIRDHLPK